MRQKNAGRTSRQAVVIIHGMGEQKPMETLRSFVDSITFWIKRGQTDRATRPRNWSRPDGASEMYETRRITMEQYGGNPKTDFYEFYWAHHMRKTSLDHLVPWIIKLLKTKRKEVPPRLKELQTTVRIGVGIVILLIAFFSLKGADYWAHIQKNWLGAAGVLALLVLLFRVIKWLLRGAVLNIILNSAGDAARYFNPMPSNIEERSSIRREGITFLKKLHDRKEKPYDRIILVGHSLGSVVAYDLLRLLWHDLHECFTPQEEVDSHIFDKMNELAKSNKIEDIEAFQQLQHQCLKQYQKNGNKWLISDFITCAGAIAHADFYQLNDIPFAELVNRKEFPTCPPVLEGSDKSLFFDGQTFSIGKDEKGTPILRYVPFLNHAAPFAITRWTNIYFTSDYVGSAAKRIFRNGIKDIEVPRKGWKLIPGGHTNYWDAFMDNEALEHICCAMGFKQVKEKEGDTEE